MTLPKAPHAGVRKYSRLGAIAVGLLPLIAVSAWTSAPGFALEGESREAVEAAAREKQPDSPQTAAPGLDAVLEGAAAQGLSPASAPGAAISTDSLAKLPFTAQSNGEGADDTPYGTELPANVLESLKSAVGARSQSLGAPSDLQTDSSAPSVGKGVAVGPNAAAPVSNFTGIAFTGAIPPDPHLATGPSDLIVAVNRTWRIYNKAGGQLFNTTLGAWFANVLPANQTGINVFDPWVIYDQVNNRYVLLALARRESDKLGRFLIAVSDNSTATGGWCNFSLNARLDGSTLTNNWADYTKVGNTNNAIVLSANMFNFPPSQTFQYTKLRFLSKAQLYNTSCPGLNWRDFWDLRNADNSRVFTLQPAHSYFASSTSYGVNSYSGGGTRLTLWRWLTTAVSPPGVTLTRQATLLPPAYSIAPNAVQRGSATRINSGDARLLNAIYRASGLWTTHTVACTWAGDATTRSCIRWYSINPNTSAISQRGTFGASFSHYYYPAIVASAVGNATIVFNRSGPNEFAGARHTGRRSTDPVNTLQGSANLQFGQGCYVRLDTVNRNRWGDYNGAAIDPVNSLRTWIFSEYAFGNSLNCGVNSWRTHVGQVTW